MPATQAKPVSARTIGRLSLYRRLLQQLRVESRENVYSHEIARLSGVSAAQVRRDFMAIGYSGSPVHGYEVQQLIDSIARFLDPQEFQNAAIVGVGNLGRSVLTYFAGRRPKLRIAAAFDTDPAKVRRLVSGCPCYPMSEFETVVAEQQISVGIISVPGEVAQSVCERMVRAGIRGIVNFAPTALQAPPNVHLEVIDMAVSLEKAAYFARVGV